MSMLLFAVIGAKINAGAAYWMLYIGYCAIKLSEAIKAARKRH